MTGDDEADGQAPALSEAQLAIMRVVWDRGEATVAEVWKALAAERTLARNTVLTMMTRLEEKGWLRRTAEGRAFRYAAAQPREQVLGGLVGRLLDTAFGGSTEGLILTLLKERGVSRDEAKRIRKLIDEARKTEKE
ncbi:BlaI/MecI/CopY family transcriptional regulator [Paludisphaera soli]|uniref:BlaI/MecI/CopY family transcriptional regulator n=1 Tax=Paludisphaera soli TaxID=2712865 RepID=UPI0013EB9694|nr:BlaI/MecI/CopY family transcriptional regulator [Paludisphaera soli]